MTDSRFTDNDFLTKITRVVEENISNEQFGVSELAHEIGMSRSNLLRKIQKSTKLSASQFIRQVRLKRAMEMFRQTSDTVSEVSYKVGFSSTSYFIKCFREFYGYPPGQVGSHEQDENEGLEKYEEKSPQKANRKTQVLYYLLFTAVAMVLLLIFFQYYTSPTQKPKLEKSIAVLPFINDSNDSTNVYIINGLMESVLGNLQQIEDLRVISRTSVEKYRSTSKTIPEIAKELNVSYFVEGSGQKIGDQILLNIQLIEASSDKHLWAEQYDRQAKDIFDLQKEVAKSITEEIQVIITPEEEERINKAPTDNLVAYDYFLKGLDLLYAGSVDGLEKSINYFKKAIEHDNNFARAHALVAIAYYYLEIFQKEKIYTEEINYYADQALLLDPKLAQSLMAKAMFYMHVGEKESAIPYLEKALEYNPNSILVINMLSDFYANHIPNTKKYLEYALKGVKIDVTVSDSATASFTYLHLSNALVQSGFIDEAEIYINKSLRYNPENLFSAYVKAYIQLARDRDLKKAKELIVQTLAKDTTRLDVLQEAGKVCYFMRDYKSAYFFYKKFLDQKKALNMDIFPAENIKIAVVFSNLGMHAEAERYFSEFKGYAENNKSIYKHLNLAVFYAYKNDKAKALEHLKLFSHEDSYHYWTVAFLKTDPLVDNIKDLPEFIQLYNKIEKSFWDHHEQIKIVLQEKELI